MDHYHYYYPLLFRTNGWWVTALLLLHTCYWFLWGRLKDPGGRVWLLRVAFCWRQPHEALWYPWSMRGEGLLYYLNACPAICWPDLKAYPVLLRAILQSRWLMILDCVFTTDTNINNCRKYTGKNEVGNLPWSDMYILTIFKQEPERARLNSHGRYLVLHRLSKLLSNRRSILATLSSLFTGQWRRDSWSSNTEDASYWL